LDEGIVIITARGTVGNLAITGRPMAMNQSCFAFRAKNSVSSYFIYKLLSNNAGYLKKIANGATFGSITIKTFEQMQIKMPSMGLIEGYADLITPMFEMVKALSQKNLLLQQTRDLLLPRLINGKLSVEHLVEQAEDGLSMAAEPPLNYLRSAETIGVPVSDNLRRKK
jgi:type I restriction enzyme S subunit